MGLRALEETCGDSAVIEKVQKLRKIGASVHDEIRRAGARFASGRAG